MTSLSILVFSSLLLAGCGGGAGGQSTTGATGTGGSGGDSGGTGAGGSGQTSSGQGGGAPAPLWSPLGSGVTVTLEHVWGTSATDVTMVGDSGTILHFDGTTFTAQTGAEGVDLVAVAGDAAGRIWTGGKGSGPFDGVIFERKGSTWVKDPTFPLGDGQLRGLFVAGPGDVYAISDEVLHLSAGVWTPLGHPFPTTGRALWAAPTATTPLLFAAGQNELAGSMFHGEYGADASVSWYPQDIPLSDPLTAVWGFAKDDIYAVG